MPQAASQPRSLGDLKLVFEALERLGHPCVLIGGQAVSYWARRYAQSSPVLREMEEVVPFVSKDIDFQGRKEACLAFARALGCRARVPGLHESFGSLIAGKFTVVVAGHPVEIEILRRVPGLTDLEVEKLSVLDRVGSHGVRVLNPAALLIAKAWNVAHLSQEDRWDAEQLLIMIPVVRLFLGQLLVQVGENQQRLRGLLRLIERLLGFAEKPLGRKVARNSGVDWSQLLPYTLIAASTLPEVMRLRETRLPRWRAALARHVVEPAPREVLRRLLGILSRHAQPGCGTAEKGKGSPSSYSRP